MYWWNSLIKCSDNDALKDRWKSNPWWHCSRKWKHETWVNEIKWLKVKDGVKQNLVNSERWQKNRNYTGLNAHHQTSFYVNVCQRTSPRHQAWHHNLRGQNKHERTRCSQKRSDLSLTLGQLVTKTWQWPYLSLTHLLVATTRALGFKRQYRCILKN